MRALLALVFLALPAGAGPWPREAGQVYVFAGHETGAGDEDGWTGLYAEYGLPRGLTLGIDAGGRIEGFATGDPERPLEGRVRGFLRVPVLSSQARRANRPDWLSPWLAAVELGLGVERETDGETPLRYSLGVTVGRPLETPIGDGWTTLDLRATGGGGWPTRLNAAAVMGAKPTGRLTTEIGLFVEREDATYWTVAPTVQYDLGRLGAARLGVSFKDGEDAILRLGWSRAF